VYQLSHCHTPALKPRHQVPRCVIIVTARLKLYTCASHPFASLCVTCPSYVPLASPLL